MSRRAAGQVNQGLACLREGWLSLRKPMYECRSMMNAQSKEISSSLTSASMDSVMDITDSMPVPRSCSAVRSSSGMFSG